MARRVQELGICRFQVIHRPRMNHGNANGLSRVPCNQCCRVETKGEEESGGIVATISWDQNSWHGPCQWQRLDEHVGKCFQAWEEAPDPPDPPNLLKGMLWGGYTMHYRVELGGAWQA